MKLTHCFAKLYPMPRLCLLSPAMCLFRCPHRDYLQGDARFAPFHLTCTLGRQLLADVPLATPDRAEPPVAPGGRP